MLCSIHSTYPESPKCVIFIEQENYILRCLFYKPMFSSSQATFNSFVRILTIVPSEKMLALPKVAEKSKQLSHGSQPWKKSFSNVNNLSKNVVEKLLTTKFSVISQELFFMSSQYIYLTLLITGYNIKTKTFCSSVLLTLYLSHQWHHISEIIQIKHWNWWIFCPIK